MSYRLDTKLPRGIARRMKMWRIGILSMHETGYIEFHAEFAKTDLLKLAGEYDLQIHSKKMVSAGNFDGMRILEAVVETPSGELKKIRWHDSHGRGTWFVCHKSGGSSPMHLSPLV